MGDACDSPSQGGGSASGVNSRHGAARGRQVTRACPGCDERISIACKFCTLCGYKFRGASGKGDTSAKGEGEEVPLGSARVSTPRSAAHALMSPKASAGGDAMTPGHDIQTPRSSHYGGDSPLTTPRGPVTCGADEEDAGGMPVRPTVTRVTPNSLELHKIKEQARRAREKQLLARLQSLLFDSRECPPSASEVTYNLVLTCAVESLRERYIRRGLDLSHLNIDEAIAPEPAVTPRDSSGHTNAEMEKHKIKEQQRRAKKRQLLSTLQGMVLGEGETTSKSTGITGNYILELVLVQLEKERLETAGAGAGMPNPPGSAVKTEESS